MEINVAYCPPPKKGVHIDPRTKVLYMLFLATYMFIVYENLCIDAVALFISVMLLCIERKIKVAIVFSTLFAVAFATIQTQGMYNFPYLLNAILGLVVSLVPFLPVFAFGYYIIESTKTDEFIAAMNRWNVPQALIIPTTVVFRFIPTIKEESSAINDAMRMREIRIGTKKFWDNPTALLEYRVIPLIMSVIQIGNELSAAALTKGLGGNVKRTSIADIGFSAYDAVLGLLSVGLIIWSIK